jgi:hypothetical protein
MDSEEPQQQIEPRKETLPIIAYKGGFELLDAKWDLLSGRTVKFRLMEEPDRPMLMHPFVNFTRRRGGRVGTRFHMAMTVIGKEEPMFTGEVMLMSGGQPLGQGFWVSFWLDDEAIHHPFAGYRGRKGDRPGDMYSAAFVELDDDDSAIDQVKRRKVEDAHARAGQTLSQYCYLLCNNEMFILYLEERALVKGTSRTIHWWAKDDRVARWVRWRCNIGSRSDLDTDKEAAKIFHEQIREPYADWRSVNE